MGAPWPSCICDRREWNVSLENQPRGCQSRRSQPPCISPQVNYVQRRRKVELISFGEILVVVKTFLKHYKTKGEKYARGDEGEASTDDIFFDE